MTAISKLTRGFKMSSRWTRIVVDETYFRGRRNAPTVQSNVMTRTGIMKYFRLRRNSAMISKTDVCAGSKDVIPYIIDKVDNLGAA